MGENQKRNPIILFFFRINKHILLITQIAALNNLEYHLPHYVPLMHRHDQTQHFCLVLCFIVSFHSHVITDFPARL